MIDKVPDNKWNDEAIMTCAEVADFLRVHLSSVRRWSRNGKLKAYKVGSRGDWRYRHSDVLGFLYSYDPAEAEGGDADVRTH